MGVEMRIVGESEEEAEDKLHGSRLSTVVTPRETSQQAKKTNQRQKYRRLQFILLKLCIGHSYQVHLVME